MITYFELFKQNPNSVNSSEIKTQYKKLAMVLHPDKHNNSLESNFLFKLLYQAYETMIDPDKCSQYKQKIEKMVNFPQKTSITKPHSGNNRPANYWEEGKHRYKNCPKCGVSLTSLDMVCYNCNLDLYNSALHPEFLTWFCESCGTINMDTRKCKTCGLER